MDEEREGFNISVILLFVGDFFWGGSRPNFLIETLM